MTVCTVDPIGGWSRWKNVVGSSGVLLRVFLQGRWIDLPTMSIHHERLLMYISRVDGGRKELPDGPEKGLLLKFHRSWNRSSNC